MTTVKKEPKETVEEKKSTPRNASHATDSPIRDKNSSALETNRAQMNGMTLKLTANRADS